MEVTRKRMTAKRKFEVYLATRDKNANVGEILRRYGLHLNDLRAIEATTEQGALNALKGRQNGRVPQTDYTTLVRELQDKERALSELAAEYTLLKKNERWGSKVPSNGFTSMGRGGRK